MNRLQVREQIRNLLNDIENSDMAHNWPDAMINEFINEATTEISQRTFCNIDSSTSAYCDITLVANTYNYQIPSGVIEVKAVRGSWDGKPLQKTNLSTILSSNATLGTIVGTPKKYLTDYTTGYITLVEMFSAVTTQKLNLTVSRLAAQLAADNVELDIPARFHRYVYNWVMYRCLQKLGRMDVEEKQYGVSMSQKFLVAFEGNPSQLGYGGDIGKIRNLTNNFDRIGRYTKFF